MSRILARVRNSQGIHQAEVQTNQQSRPLQIPPKPEGYGSSVNGGELLFLALATCYCNDVYREAAKKNIPIQSVEVTVEGEFGAEGEPAQSIHYRVKVNSPADPGVVESLLRYTDTVAEIQNTVRLGVPVTLQDCVILADAGASV